MSDHALLFSAFAASIQCATTGLATRLSQMELIVKDYAHADWDREMV